MVKKARFLKSLSLILLLTEVACASGKRRVSNRDPQNAIDFAAPTGLVDCYGGRVVPGGCILHVVEGETTEKTISFFGPPVKECSREKCVFVKVVNNQGHVVFGEGIEKGKTRVTARWSQLLRDNPEDPEVGTFRKGYRGWWGFLTEVFYIDENGHEQRALSTGDIVLRVFGKDYIPLNDVSEDPYFVWKWSEGNQVIKMTTGMRTYVSRKGGLYVGFFSEGFGSPLGSF